jgi:hypothetical protein
VQKYARFLAPVAILVIVFGTIYGVAQQAQRNDANMPQIQLAEQNAASLNKTGNVQTLSQSYIDLGSSLDPFVIIYDKNGTPVSGSGYLNGALPQIPKGVLTSSKGKDYHAVTWQPTGKLRFATVAVAANDFYVVSGRSLKIVEQNETKTLRLSVFGGLAALVVLSSAYYFAPKQKNPRK